MPCLSEALFISNSCEVSLSRVCVVFIQDSYSYVRSTASAVGYDSKQYYQQPTATAAVAAAQPQPTVADSYYQSGMVDYLQFLLVVCFTITNLGILTAPCGLNTPPEAFFSFLIVCCNVFKGWHRVCQKHNFKAYFWFSSP